MSFQPLAYTYKPLFKPQYLAAITGTQTPPALYIAPPAPLQETVIKQLKVQNTGVGPGTFTLFIVPLNDTPQAYNCVAASEPLNAAATAGDAKTAADLGLINCTLLPGWGIYGNGTGSVCITCSGIEVTVAAA